MKTHGQLIQGANTHWGVENRPILNLMFCLIEISMAEVMVDKGMTVEWNDTDKKKNRITLRTTHPSATLSTTNTTKTGMRLIPGLRRQLRMVANHGIDPAP
jgi:hypothetical protein